MKRREGQAPVSPALWWEMLVLLAEYRREMPVCELVVFSSSFYGQIGYYRCPRCRITMEREFTAFCDRCGQRLGWKDYKKARVIYPGQHKPSTKET